MKFEEKIKQKYLHSSGFNLIKNLYFYIQALKSKKFIKKSYSGGAQDLIINYFFKDKKKVFILMLVVIIHTMVAIQSCFMIKVGQE